MFVKKKKRGVCSVLLNLVITVTRVNYLTHATFKPVIIPEMTLCGGRAGRRKPSTNHTVSCGHLGPRRSRTSRNGEPWCMTRGQVPALVTDL